MEQQEEIIRENQDNPLAMLTDVPLDNLMSYLSTKDTISLSMSCHSLWTKSNVIRAKKLQHLSGFEPVLMARYKAKIGDLAGCLALLAQGKADPVQLIEQVLEGGFANVFWHFVDAGWLDLEKNLYEGERIEQIIEHQLAYFGHLDLLKQVLAHTQSKRIYDVDKLGESILHKAAAGNRTDTFVYLVQEYYHDRELPLDNFGSTVAHSAASGGAIDFLDYLLRTDPEYLKVRNHFGGTILHSVSHFPYMSVAGKQLLSIMIDEFKMDVRAKDDEECTVVHALAAADHWEAVAFLADRYGLDLLDMPQKQGETVRYYITYFEAEKHFPNNMLDQLPQIKVV